jgi:hypothetical protein
MCLGEGKVKTLEAALEESAKKSEARNKDLEDAEESEQRADTGKKAKTSRRKADKV